MDLQRFITTVLVALAVFVIFKLFVKKRLNVTNRLNSAIHKIRIFRRRFHRRVIKISTKKNYVKKKRRVNMKFRMSVKDFRRAQQEYRIYLFEKLDDKKVSLIKTEFDEIENIIKKLVIIFLQTSYDKEKKLELLKESQSKIDIICASVIKKTIHEQKAQKTKQMMDI